MRNIIIFTLGILLAGAISSSAFAGKTDLMLRSIDRNAVQYSMNPDVAAPVEKAVIKSDGMILIPAIIKTMDAHATVDAIEELGGKASYVADNLITAEIPAGTVSEITSRGEVVFAEAGTPLTKKMDTARAASYVDIVQNGTALGTAYDGTNVVVGIVDDGLDYGHDDFKKSDGTTRVEYMAYTSGGTLYECTKGTIDAGNCEISEGGLGYYHGTHVTGIAASGNLTYTGVAPKADIMFYSVGSASDVDTSGTGSSSFSTVILNGVSKIFEKADELNKAAVVNLSLGTSTGAHDGTSLLEQSLTTLSTAKAGRIIVNAAGNEQVPTQEFAAGTRDFVGGIHAPIDVAAGSSEGMRFAIWSGSDAAGSVYGGGVTDIWLDSGTKDNCSVAVFAYTGGRSTPDFTFPGVTSTSNAVLATSDVPFSTDTTTAVTASGGSVEVSIEVDSEDGRNFNPHALVVYSPASGSSSSNLAGVWFDVVIRASAGGACAGHMWFYPDLTSIGDFLTGIAGGVIATGAKTGYTLSDGDSAYTATIPSTAAGVISAGSWLPEKPIGEGKSQWTGDNGITYNQTDYNSDLVSYGTALSDLSSFSSLGPTYDGRPKPDVVAPGEPIISTKARDVNIPSALTVGESHFKLAGTSMASPHVTGIVALLLQRNNTLTVEQVRTALRTEAITTGLTAKYGSAENSYGAGKVDAAKALRSVSANTSDYSGTGDLDGDSTGTTSTCALVSGRSSRSAYWVFMFGLIILAFGLRKITLNRNHSGNLK